MDPATGISGLLSLLRALLLPGIDGLAVILVLIIPYAVRAFRKINQANLELDRECEYLKKCKAGIKVLQESRRYATWDDIASWLAQVDTESRVRKCILAVWSTRIVPNPDMEAISSMLAQSESHRLGIAKGTPNALMLSGLIGTVLGLAGAVSRLPQQIQSSSQSIDPMALTQNLSMTLQHMQSAFACTFWGILLAVIISRKVNTTAARQSAFLADLQEFGIGQLSPYVIPSSVAVQLGDVKVTLQQSQEFMERVSGLMHEAAERFERVLSDAGTAMISSSKDLQSVTADLQTSLVNVSSNVLSSAEELKESSRVLENSHKELHSVHEAMESFFAKSTDQLERQAEEQLSKMHDLQQDFATSAQNIVSAINNTSDGLSGTTQAFRSCGESFRTAADCTSSKMDTGFEMLIGSLKESLKKHDSEMSRVDDAVNRVSERLADLCSRLDPKLMPREEWQGVTESLRTATDALLQNRAGQDGGHASSSQIDFVIPGMVRDLKDTIRSQYEGLNAVQRELANAAKSMADSSSMMEKRLLPREEWSSLLTAISSQVREMKNQFMVTDPMGMVTAGVKKGEVVMDKEMMIDFHSPGTVVDSAQRQTSSDVSAVESLLGVDSSKGMVSRVIGYLRRTG